MELAGKNFYEILGVPRDATKEQVRESYKELARIYHPDSHYFDDIAMADSGPSHDEVTVFKAITEAYHTLSNEKRRGEYDQTLPIDTPGWDADVKTEFMHDKLEQQFQSPEAQQPFSWGTFGKFECNEGPSTEAARQFQDEFYQPVSQILKQQRSVLGRLLNIIRGNRR